MTAEDFDPQRAFLQLHATFTHRPELLDLYDSGTPLHTIVSLYPVEPATYLPYFRTRFATRQIQKQDNLWAVSGALSPYTLGFQVLLEGCTPEDSRYYSDSDLGPEVVALIEEHVDPQDPTNWNRSNLTFEVTNVVDLANRLLHLNLADYSSMEEYKRSDLRKELAALSGQFKAYESGIDFRAPAK